MESTTQTQPGPNPAWQPPPVVRPPLVRSRSDRKIAGVAGGLAAHLGVDPLWIRIAFVVLSIPGGLGVLLYMIGWALIPEEGQQAAAGEGFLEYLRRAPSWLPIALLVLAGLVFFGDSGGPRVFWAAALIGAGVWLYHNDARHQSPVGPPVGPPAGTTPTAAADMTVDAPPPPASPPPPALFSQAAYAPRPYSPPPPPRPRSFLARYTLAAMLVVLGVTAALDNIGAFKVSARIYPALALLVVAAGLLVGVFWGRSRLLVLGGLLILPVALTASLVRVPIRGGTGDRVYTPGSVQSIQSEYRLAAGSIRLDLTQLAWGTSAVTTRIRLAAGQIDVIVPNNVAIDFHGHAGAGQIELPNGIVRNGVNVDLVQQSAAAGNPAATPRLTLDAEVSLGHIQVEREGFPVPAPDIPSAPSPPAAPPVVPAAP